MIESDNAYVQSYLHLSSPRFELASRAARSVLLELDNPSPPIPFENYVYRRKWKIIEDELYGPDGYMVKISQNNKLRFVIFLATDADLNSLFDEQTIRRRQYFTAAHELGHILLHGNFLLNSRNHLNAIPEDVNNIMEIEAHWFASRLLMPDYIFETIADLIPECLAEKCRVNLTPAQKRLKNLNPSIRSRLFKAAHLNMWPSHLRDKAQFICPQCGFFHNEEFPELSGQFI